MRKVRSRSDGAVHLWREKLGGIMDYTAVRGQTNTTSTNDKFEKDNEGSEDSADTECGPQRQNREGQQQL